MDEGVERVHQLLLSPAGSPLPAGPRRKKRNEREVANSRGRWPAVILGHSENPCKRSDWLLSFFDDGEETAPRPSTRVPRTPQRPRPRRAQHNQAALPLDQHTLM